MPTQHITLGVETIGVVYAILRAYVVIIVWQQFDMTTATVQREAVAADNIYNGVDSFPEPARTNVKTAVKEYVQVTVDEEWPLLADNEMSPQAEALAENMRSAIDQLPADSRSEQVMFGHVLTNYEQLLTARRLRIFQGQEGLHPLLWALLIGGAVLSIGYTYSFGVDHWLAHALMIAGLALLIGAMLFMIQQVEHPFAGQLHVLPKPFQRVLAGFD